MPSYFRTRINVTYQPAGREAYSYLAFIMGWEFEFTGDIILAQGDPFKHDPDFLEHVVNPDIRYYGKVHECSKDGMPACDWTPLDGWCHILGLEPPAIYKFVAGAQYRITLEQVESRSLAFYRALFYLTTIPENKSAWCLERLWPLIWNISL